MTESQTVEPETLPGLWYAAAPARALKTGRVVARTILGRPLALGRDQDGAAFAVEDLCPHRGALLSAGGFDGRELVCPFHGWRFRTDGTCAGVPSLAPDQEVDISKFRTPVYDVRERQGIVWVRAPGAGPDEPPSAQDLGNVRPKVATELIFETDMDNAVFGLLDPAHGPYVHQSRLWRSPEALQLKSKAFEPVDDGFRMVRHPPSSNAFIYKLLGGDRTTEITFRIPGWRCEHIRVGRHVIANVTAMTPISATRTRALNLLYWTNPVLDVFKPLMSLLARRFLGQDQAIVAVQNRGLAFAPKTMLVMDADAQQRWYLALKRAWRKAVDEGVPFENPVRPATLRWRT